jgi:hypothetical protein
MQINDNIKKKLKFPISYNQIISTDKMGVSFFGLLIISPSAPRKKKNDEDG